jgi:hypothetical protein
MHTRVCISACEAVLVLCISIYTYPCVKTYEIFSLNNFVELNQSKPINPSNAELNPIRHLLALVGARHIVHVSRIRVKHLILRRQMFLSIS